jgi:hypothetical protein
LLFRLRRSRCDDGDHGDSYPTSPVNPEKYRLSGINPGVPTKPGVGFVGWKPGVPTKPGVGFVAWKPGVPTKPGVGFVAWKPGVDFSLSDRGLKVGKSPNVLLG